MPDLRNQFGECDRWVRQRVKREGIVLRSRVGGGAAQYSYIPPKPPRYE